MKIREIITESDIDKVAQEAVPELSVFDDAESESAYDSYRFGIALASSPDSDGIDSDGGPAKNRLMTIAYTDEEADMINMASKKLGRTHKALTTKDSSELPDTYTQSPIQPKGPIKRKS